MQTQTCVTSVWCFPERSAEGLLNYRGSCIAAASVLIFTKKERWCLGVHPKIAVCVYPYILFVTWKWVGKAISFGSAAGEPFPTDHYVASLPVSNRREKQLLFLGKRILLSDTRHGRSPGNDRMTFDTCLSLCCRLGCFHFSSFSFPTIMFRFFERKAIENFFVLCFSALGNQMFFCRENKTAYLTAFRWLNRLESTASWKKERYICMQWCTQNILGSSVSTAGMLLCAIRTSNKSIRQRIRVENVNRILFCPSFHSLLEERINAGHTFFFLSKKKGDKRAEGVCLFNNPVGLEEPSSLRKNLLSFLISLLYISFVFFSCSPFFVPNGKWATVGSYNNWFFSHPSTRIAEVFGSPAEIIFYNFSTIVASSQTTGDNPKFMKRRLREVLKLGREIWERHKIEWIETTVRILF